MVTVAGQVLRNAVAISAGGSHSLVLRNDGTVTGFGYNYAGQAVGFQTPYPHTANEPVKIAGYLLSNVTAIAAGHWSSFSVALKREDAVVGWGDNHFGQTTIPDLGAVTAIASGVRQVLALGRDGLVRTWGQGNSPPPGLSNVVAISTGGEYGRNLALKKDGTVVEWPVMSAEYVSTVPQGLSNVVAISAGGGHGLALTRNGTIVGWGANRWGQATGVPTPEFPHESTGTVMVADQILSNIVAIAAGEEFSLGLKKDSTVVIWGTPGGRPLGVPDGVTNVTAIAAGRNFCLAITTNLTDRLKNIMAPVK